MSTAVNLALFIVALAFWPFAIFVMQRINARPVRANRKKVIRNLDGFILFCIIAVIGSVGLVGFGILCVLSTQL